MHRAHPQPSDWVQRFVGLTPDPCTALDVACGDGRHTRLLRTLGHHVTAVDRDVSGVADLADDPLVEVLEADLENGSPWPLADRRFGCVLVTNYLWRPLLPALVDAVLAGGVLIYETFARGNERFGRPANPEFLLRPGELLEAVRGRLEVVAFEHGTVQDPKPAVRQRICAVRATDPRDLNVGP